MEMAAYELSIRPNEKFVYLKIWMQKGTEYLKQIIWKKQSNELNNK